MEVTRRGKLEVYYDILKAISSSDIGNIKPTVIQLKVNMSYDKMMNNLKELETKEFVQTEPIKITEKGLKFLYDYKDVKKVITEMREKYFGVRENEPEVILDKTILVVDDDKEFLDMTCDIIEEFGYHVLKAVDAHEASEKYQKNKPDLVLMDIKLPDKNGFESFFELRKDCPDVKVIFMTGHQDFSHWQKAKQKGAVYLIKKPFPAEFLKELITRHVKEPEI